MPSEFLETGLQRRVIGLHDIRLDGILDLTIRAKGASVFDIGCNRGLVSLEMANNGARLCHGCDNFAEGIETARQIFADMRNVESRFEVVNLNDGPISIEPFGNEGWDIVLMLATFHKIKRVMQADNLAGLMRHIGHRTKNHFGWRGPRDVRESDEEMVALDKLLEPCGLRRVHTSYISQQIGPAAIWSRT